MHKIIKMEFKLSVDGGTTSQGCFLLVTKFESTEWLLPQNLAPKKGQSHAGTAA
jgi:hypothetical protein